MEARSAPRGTWRRQADDRPCEARPLVTDRPSSEASFACRNSKAAAAGGTTQFDGGRQAAGWRPSGRRVLNKGEHPVGHEAGGTDRCAAAGELAHLDQAAAGANVD